MKAVITVVGGDRVGIVAKTCTKCFEFNVNILDISQRVVDNMFTMTMVVDVSECNIPFTQFVDEMNRLGQELGQNIHTMHENIFKSMHRI